MPSSCPVVELCSHLVVPNEMIERGVRLHLWIPVVNVIVHGATYFTPTDGIMSGVSGRSLIMLSLKKVELT